MTAAQFAERLRNVRAPRQPRGWWGAACPAHHDEAPSLRFRDGDVRLVLRCMAGCREEAILGALALTVTDLRHNGHRRGAARRIVATYPYVDEAGVLLYEVVRFEPKEFRCRRPDGRGGWTWSLDDVRIVPYRLRELPEARRVYGVEGENDCDTLAALGLVATTNHGGAGKWREEHTRALVEAAVPEVVVLRDNDRAGAAHQDLVVRSCLAAGLRVKRLVLPGLPPLRDKHGEDVTDWLAAGHTVDELQALADAAPVLDSGAAAPEGDFEVDVDQFDAPGAWPIPQSLAPALPPVPAFEPDRLLPAPLRPWVEDIAERAQCPIEMVAVSSMAVIAAVVGRQVAIRPKRHDTWTVIPNVWSLVVAPPGVLKTYAMAEPKRPVAQLVKAARVDYEARLAAYAVALADWKAQQEALQARLKAIYKAQQPAQAASIREQLQVLKGTEPTKPTERRFETNDATVEKLGELLNENPNGLLVFRDELIGWLRTLEREGHQNDRSFFCEAWNGDGAYIYDRIGRGTVYVPHMCLSLVGGIQPRPLAAFLQGVVRHDQRDDDGLVQRFQLAVYPDIARAWRNVDRAPDREAAERATMAITRLADLSPEALGADIPFNGAVPVLRFDPEAQAAFDAWREALEHRLRDPDTDLLPIMVSHLAKYRSLVPKVALLIHLVDCVDRGMGGRVSLGATERAIAWAQLLEAHAARIYASVTARAEQAAEVLAGKLQRGKLRSPFRVRQLTLKHWTELTEPEDVVAALGILEDAGWVRRVKVPSSHKGGRPTTDYYINPLVYGS